MGSKDAAEEIETVFPWHVASDQTNECRGPSQVSAVKNKSCAPQLIEKVQSNSFTPKSSIPNPTSSFPSSQSPTLPNEKKKKREKKCTSQQSHRQTKSTTHINSHIAQLRPTHRMVQIVLAKVILRQIGNIRKLDVRDIRRFEHADVHFCELLCLSSRFDGTDVWCRGPSAMDVWYCGLWGWFCGGLGDEVAFLVRLVLGLEM